MIIRGILDSSLNGQLCIRGFANIKKLASISKADYSYQRYSMAEQEETIREFLDTEKYLFFPEIILSYKVKHSFNDKKNTITPINRIISKKKYTSSVDKTVLTLKSLNYNNIVDASNKHILSIVELFLDEEMLSEAIKNNQHPFHRIDGNHRLKAAELSQTSKVDSMVAPFCILLGEEFYLNNVLVSNPSTELFNKSVKIFFHNINTKTLPLTSEENLKVIIDDSINFPDKELEEILGKEALYTRYLSNKKVHDYFTGIKHIIADQYRTFYIDIFTKLLNKEMNCEDIVEKVFESLKTIEQLYNQNSKLKTNSSFGLLTAFLYYHIEDPIGKYTFFKEWVFTNHIFEIEEIKAESIIRIFDKIAIQEIKVFVAMPFFNNDPDIIEEHNRVYKKEIEKISNEFKVKITLYRIMQNAGATEDQIQDIINKIQNCSIFIANITDNNANVLYEMGWARALKKPTIIVRDETSDKPKSDYLNDTYHSYKKESLSTTLGDIVRRNLIEVLSKNYGLITKQKK